MRYIPKVVAAMLFIALLCLILTFLVVQKIASEQTRQTKLVIVHRFISVKILKTAIKINERTAVIIVNFSELSIFTGYSFKNAATR